MKRFLRIQWHFFWYKYHCNASARNAAKNIRVDLASSEKDEHFMEFWRHGQILQKLDPELVKRYAEESMKKAFPTK